MTATINDFFGNNLEQEVMDEIVILPFTGVNYKAGYSTQISMVDFASLDHVIVGMSGFDGIGLNATITVDGSYLKQSSWTVTGIVDDSKAAISARVALVKTDNNIKVVVDARLGSMPQAGVKYITGYKRRIARVGLDELMASMGMPNLVTNPDLNNPVNQRAFNGNWGALAIGAYGYDQWIKVSNTHMGFVVEDGKYIPNKLHTLTINNAVIKQIMSPASGHFVVAIPFATSGVYDFYVGEFKRPWHPPEGALNLCARYYYITKGFYVSYGASGAALQRTSVHFPDMRKNPSITLEKTDGTMGAVLGVIHQNHCVLSFSSTAASQEWFGNVKCDATIPWSELNNKVITAA